VHGVYNTISSHFSHTRYKPWPKVVEFLESLPDGSWVADVGKKFSKVLTIAHLQVNLLCDDIPRIPLGCSASTYLNVNNLIPRACVCIISCARVLSHSIGCGNGKYINVNPRLIYAGSDRSTGLAEECRKHGHEVCTYTHTHTHTYTHTYSHTHIHTHNRAAAIPHARGSFSTVIPTMAPFRCCLVNNNTRINSHTPTRTNT
jgi:hypothetical protein